MNAYQALAQERCDRCDHDQRRELLRDAVIEAARQVLAWHLREERTLPDYSRTLATTETVAALQDLRDACHAERASR